jgi:Cu/Ag efflux protein CusF
MKSIKTLSLVLLTAMAFAALPAMAQDTTTTNTAPATPRRARPQFQGTVSAVDATAMTLTLKGRAGDTTVKVNSETKITKQREPAVFGDIKEGDRVSGNGTKQDDGSWVAKTVTIRAPRKPAGDTTTPPATTPPATTETK